MSEMEGGENWSRLCSLGRRVATLALILECDMSSTQCSVGFSGIKLGLVLLRKDGQCLIGPLFTPIDAPTCVTIVKKKHGCDSE